MSPANLPSWMVEPPEEEAETIEMRLAARHVPAEDVVWLELTPLGGEEAPAWEPGAHVDIHLPGGMVRQYSLCGSPSDPRSLHIAVLLEKSGRGGSGYLHEEAEVGDVLEVGKPRNHFPLEPAPRYMFVAGGIGITPLLPMIEEVDAAGAEWSLLYGGRSRRSMLRVAELGEDPRVTVHPQDELGLLDLGLLEEPLTDTLIYCCGPEPLLKAVEAAAGHWPEGALRVERFKARDDLPSGPGREFEVLLRRSDVALTVAPGQSILDAVAKAGISVPSSCEEGTCGTCETIVLEGEPEHRDSILSEAERAANDCMMICCSRARSDRLVLDL